MFFDMPEPYPDEVDGSELADAIRATILRRVVLPHEAADAITMWLFFAWAHDSWDLSPRLAIVSPEKRCGKSTLLEVIAALVPRPVQTSNTSPAAIYRLIEQERPTLVIDEADCFLNRENEELRGIINSAHLRTMSYVLRTVGEQHEVRQFSTWTPMVLARIGAFPGTIADRSIVVTMRRKRPGEGKDAPTRREMRGECATHVAKLAAWARDYASFYSGRQTLILPGLDDRAADNWGPLATLAADMGEGWAARIRNAAAVLTGAGFDEASYGTMVLEDLRGIYAETGADRMKSSVLCDRLIAIEERPWGDMWGGKPITPARLAKLLRPYNVTPGSIREGDETGKGYLLGDLKEVFERYCPLPLQKGDTPTQRSTGNAIGLPFADTEISDVPITTATNANTDNGCDGVPPHEGGGPHPVTRKACYACGTTDVWTDGFGVDHCARCHPPAITP